MPSNAPTRPQRSRTIDLNDIGERSFSLPESWLRGVLAGAEGVLGAWLVLIVPAIAVYIATAAAPELGAASWMEAARIGTGIWLAAHGAHLSVGGITFTLLPLGVTLLALGLTTVSMRRASLETWVSIALALITYVLGALMLSGVAGVAGSTRALLGAFLIPALAILFAAKRQGLPALPPGLIGVAQSVRRAGATWVEQHPAETKLRTLGMHTARAIRVGISTGLRTLLIIGVLSTALVVTALVTGASVMIGIHEGLEVDLVSSIVFTGMQLLLLPTLVVWAAAYLTGGGFAVGEGTLYSPAEVLGAPLPALPVLGALPNLEQTPLPALGFVFLFVGALAGWILHRRLSGVYRGQVPAGVSIGGAVVAVGIPLLAMALLTALTSGGFGPDRLAHDVGPLLGPVLRSLTWQLAAPMAVVLIAASPTTGHLVSAGRQRLRRSREGAGAAGSLEGSSSGAGDAAQ